MLKTIPSYINKKGKEVILSISHHAVQRFVERRSKAFPGETLLNSEIIKDITNRFFAANKIKNLSRQDNIRLNKYGKDTMFFRTNAFTFVVKNATIVTVELSDKNLRCLN